MKEKKKDTPEEVSFWFVKLLSNHDAGAVGLCAVVPVQEAFHIDDVANIQSLSSCVNVGASAVTNHVSVDGEGVGVGAVGDIEVNVTLAFNHYK